MTYLWLLLIPYTTAAFGIHGGEGITGVNRQVRNLICALPFALVAFVTVEALLPYPYAHLLVVVAFVLAYVGANMGFDEWPLWFKGFVTLPPLGAALLPLAYAINTKWKNVFQEYFSGTLYGAALAAIAIGVSL
jgi:peptidoglycan/LPS O-acetylase OafA/YrhL